MSGTPPPPPAPTDLRRRLDRLQGERNRLARDRRDRDRRLQEVFAHLGLAEAVESALDKLSEQLFGRITRILEEKLSLALSEVLEQPIRLRVVREFKRGAAAMAFHVERDGRPEDILRGQGGSVANVLSVGLRLFALTTLDPAAHRRFLVLDEQDCWLRPDLVPRLVRIIHEAGSALGFQTLVISHHDARMFEPYAERIYHLAPGSDGVSVVPRHSGAKAKA